MRRTLPLVLLAACSSTSVNVVDGGASPDLPDSLTTTGCAERPLPFAPLSTRCGNFVDGEGRSVVLVGVNARVDGVFDVDLGPGRVPLQVIPSFSLEDARRMRSAGFNVLRLPMQWSGVEPTEDGGFSTAYLDRVAAVVALCREAGLFVLLDLHQDAYSKEIGEDGAPLWAIVPPPERLLEGPLTDLIARRVSPQVLRAFGTFFGDGADGDRLRQRFARMAAAVASRFRDDRTVVGYEVFNEPVASDPQVRRLNLLVAQAMRAADPSHLIFFEPEVTSRNLFDRSPVPSAPFAVAGGVYAPHTYPLSFTGTEMQRMAFTRDTLVPSVRSARDEATAWGTPLAITEWGYDPAGIRADRYYELMQDVQGAYGASAMLWLWKERSQGSWGMHRWDETRGVWEERAEVFQWLARPRPVAIAGDLRSWSWDATTRVFTVRWDRRNDVTAPHELWLPPPASAWTLRCEGAADINVDTAGRARVRCATGATELTATRAL